MSAYDMRIETAKQIIVDNGNCSNVLCKYCPCCKGLECTVEGNSEEELCLNTIKICEEFIANNN